MSKSKCCGKFSIEPIPKCKEKENQTVDTSFLLLEKRQRNLPLHLSLCCKQVQFWECEWHGSFLVLKLGGPPRFRIWISAMLSSSFSSLLSMSLHLCFINSNYHIIFLAEIVIIPLCPKLILIRLPNFFVFFFLCVCIRLP